MRNALIFSMQLHCMEFTLDPKGTCNKLICIFLNSIVNASHFKTLSSL
jgi:hypothetical protein